VTKLFVAKKINVDITDELDGRRVRYILRNHLGLSVSLIRRLKSTEDGMLLNGRPVHLDTCVNKGDVLCVTVYDNNSGYIIPIALELDILYEDDDVILINKPSGMPSHPSLNHREDTLANGLMYYFRNRPFTVRIITRLDRETSGVVLVAKNPVSAQKLSDEMCEKNIHKTYIASINGKLIQKRGTISAPVSRKENSAILRCVSNKGKEAITEYEVLKELNGLSLIKLHPKTGRTHQLRVHMSYMGTPIYGDDLYGAPQKNERTRLHCYEISFVHPMRGEMITVSAPVPYDITQLFEE